MKSTHGFCKEKPFRFLISNVRVVIHLQFVSGCHRSSRKQAVNTAQAQGLPLRCSVSKPELGPQWKSRLTISPVLTTGWGFMICLIQTKRCQLPTRAVPFFSSNPSCRFPLPVSGPAPRENRRALTRGPGAGRGCMSDHGSNYVSVLQSYTRRLHRTYVTMTALCSMVV